MTKVLKYIPVTEPIRDIRNHILMNFKIYDYYKFNGKLRKSYVAVCRM